MASPIQASELHEVVRQGIFSNIVAAISASTNINERDKSNGSTPLHWAANKDREDIVQYLISKGADVNAVDRYGDTPLCWVISHSRTNVLPLLLTNKARINTTNINGQTPLHYACKDQAHISVVKMLVVNGANLDASDRRGMRPIDYENREDVKLFLINNNAIMRGEIHEAVISRNIDKVRSLIQRDANIVSETSRGLTEKQFQQDQDLENMSFLSNGDINNERRYFIGWQPLHFAVAKGYMDIINILISKGAFIDAKDKDENTPLIVAIVKRDEEIVKILINNGADIVGNYRPFQEAVFRNAKDIAELLIKKGADVNCHDPDNLTPPLHRAAQLCYDEIVVFLISKGADVNARSGFKNQTPLHCAVNGITPKWAVTNSKSQDARKAEIITSLIRNGANINVQDTNGRTPLLDYLRSWGVSHKRDSSDSFVVKLLVQEGSDVNIADNDRWTPLHYAALLDLPVVEFLIKNGANVNTRDNLGRTPLHYASGKGNTNAIVLMINNGADINALDDSTYTPLDCAKLPWVEYIIQGYGGVSAKKLREEKAAARAKALAEYERDRQHEEILQAIGDMEAAARDAEDAARDAESAARDSEDAALNAEDAARPKSKYKRVPDYGP